MNIMQLKENKTIKQILTTFKGARIMVENYKTGLKFKHIEDVDVIIISSIHFGEKNNKPYIHLNDNEPNSNIFNEM